MYHYRELSKKDKKIVWALIEKGTLAEFRKGLLSFDKILKGWDSESSDHREYYHKLYDRVIKFDKHIAWRYDRMGGSQYLNVLGMQIADGFITVEELAELEPETIDKLMLLSGKRSLS